MATDFHVRVRRVLEQVTCAAPADREPLLRQSCGADTGLLREALSLLPHYVQVGHHEPPRPVGTAWRLPGTTTFLKVRGEAERPDAEDLEPAEPRPPFTLDRYTVVQVLGRGGMGLVYRAVHPTLPEIVAIKLLRRRLASGQQRWRFMFEEEILRQLRHPGIARFMHSGVAQLRPTGPHSGFDERPYFVMEYVPGRPLTRYAQECGLDPRQRLLLLARVCDAMEYAHRRGVVHCDLKPDNILVCADGQPKIVDFGIARVATFDGSAGIEGRGVAATLPYASPEQLVGRVEQLTPASDVYTLGLIAHELLSGELPARAGGARRLALDGVRLPERTAADAARSAEFRYYVHGVLATALRQTRGQPYRSAGELGADLESVAAAFLSQSRWQKLVKRLAGERGPGAVGATPLVRPLNALLRKRIGMALEAPPGGD